MNIFVLDENPSTAAAYHCDKHVVKMIVETAQILSTAHWELGGSAPYKSTHINHPVNCWTRMSSGNYDWLSRLGLHLCYEYTIRYDNIHKTENIIRELINNFPPKIVKGERTKFIRCMPDDFKLDDPILSYRNYYMKSKKHFATWKYTSPPHWWNPDSSEPSVQIEYIKLPWEKK